MSDRINIDFGARAHRRADARRCGYTRHRADACPAGARLSQGQDRQRRYARLLKDDIDQTQARNREWVETSGGQWKSGSLELVVPGPGAAAFHGYFMRMMKEDRQPELRAGHPEHFMNVPLGLHAEVIENVGQDDLPWFIRLDFTPPDTEFPAPWDPAYPAEHRLGAFINDADGLRIGSAQGHSVLP